MLYCRKEKLHQIKRQVLLINTVMNRNKHEHFTISQHVQLLPFSYVAPGCVQLVHCLYSFVLSSAQSQIFQLKANVASRSSRGPGRRRATFVPVVYLSKSAQLCRPSV